MAAYNSLSDRFKPEVDRRHDGEICAHESDTPSSVAAFRHRPASIPGQHGVPFGTSSDNGMPRQPGEPERNTAQAEGQKSGRKSANSVELPSVDAPRQEKIDFLVQHEFCFGLAFSGNCVKPSCPFDHDTSIVPAGHFRAPAPAHKRRKTDQGRDETSVSRPKPKLYALSNEMVGMLAAVMGGEFNPDDEARYDACRCAPEAKAILGNVPNALTGPSPDSSLGALAELLAAVSDSQQLWVQGKVMHPRGVEGRTPVSIMIDTGAGGGNYVSLSFWESIQSWGGSAVHRQLSVKGKFSLLTANPTGSKEPGMTILGSTVLPIVLPPDGHVRNITVRVV